MNKRIKSLRKALNLTQQEFADRLNIGRGTLANYEVGRNEPIDAVVSLICHEFGVNESWLRAGEGSMFAKGTNTALEELAAEFYLDSFDEALIQEYVLLTPNQKKIFRTFFYRVLMKSIGDAKPEELLKTEMGYPSIEESKVASEAIQKELIQQYQATKNHQQEQMEVAKETSPFWKDDTTDEELHAELDRQLRDEKEQKERLQASQNSRSNDVKLA